MEQERSHFSKKIIELGVEEACQNNHEFVGTEHLLLGIPREGEGIGVDILSHQNITYLRVKEEILAYLEADKALTNPVSGLPLWLLSGPYNQ